MNENHCDSPNSERRAARQNTIALLDSGELGGKVEGGRSSSGRKQVLHVPVAHGGASARLQLKNAVEELKDARVLREVANGAETQLLTFELNQDEVIIGRAMPDQSLLGPIRLIKAERTGTKVVAPADGMATRDGALWASVDWPSEGNSSLCGMIRKTHVSMRRPVPVVFPRND